MSRSPWKWIAVLLIAVFALSGVGVAVQAAPVADNATRYMPADTWLYVSMRVDDEFITDLDGLINKIAQATALTGGGTIPPSPIRTALTLGLAQAGLNLQSDIRPWLGQRIAFGVGNPALVAMSDSPEPEDVPAVLAVDITDQAAADAFVTKLLDMGNATAAFRRSEGSQFISYESQMAQQMPINILITSDALLIGTQVGLAAARGDGTSLADAPRFTDTLKAMPADSYNVLFYVDANALYGELFASMERMPGMDERQMGMALDQMRQMMNAIGGMAIGATILDGRSLTLDISQQITDPSALYGSANALAAFTTPVDPQFLALLPANTVAVSQGTNIGGAWSQVMQALQAQQAMMEPDMARRFEREMAQALSQFQEATGLDLEKDVLSWMTGDAAAFVGYTPPTPGAPSALWSMVTNDEATSQDFDFGVVVEATNPAAAANVVERLGASLEEQMQKRPAPRVSLVREPVRGSDAVIIRIDMPGLDAPLDFVLASNDQVMVFATRPAAEAILSGQGGFAQKPAFVEAQKYVLPGTVQLHYFDTGLIDFFVDFAALQVVEEDLAIIDDVIEHIFEGQRMDSLPEPNAADLAETRREYNKTLTIARQVTPLISSASISSVITDGTRAVGRLVLTLGE